MNDVSTELDFNTEDQVPDLETLVAELHAEYEDRIAQLETQVAELESKISSTHT